MPLGKMLVGTKMFPVFMIAPIDNWCCYEIDLAQEVSMTPRKRKTALNNRLAQELSIAFCREKQRKIMCSHECKLIHLRFVLKLLKKNLIRMLCQILESVAWSKWGLLSLEHKSSFKPTKPWDHRSWWNGLVKKSSIDQSVQTHHSNLGNNIL